MTARRRSQIIPPRRAIPPTAAALATERDRALAIAQAERERLRDMVMQSSASIAVLRGPTHVLELVNLAYQRIINGRQVVGKTVRQALPALEGQGFFEQLDSVYATGQPFVGTEIPMQIDPLGDGTLETVYLNSVYQATRDPWGAIDGIVAQGVDVTAQVRTRRRTEQLAGAAEAFARAELDLPALMDAIVRRVTEAIGDAGTLHLLRSDGQTLALEALSCPEPDEQARIRRLMRDAPLRVGEGISGRVVQTGNVVRVAELDGEAYRAALPPSSRAALEHVAIHSVLGVPLRTGGRVAGALTLWRSRRGRPYTTEDQALLQDLADRAALAVDNARLYEAERAARAAAEAALEAAREAEVAREAALRNLAQREAEAASLRELARLKDEFLGTISHELRTPLQVIYGYAELLQLRIRTSRAGPGPDVPALAGRILASAGELAGMVDSLLDFSQMERGELAIRPQDVDLVPVLHDAVAALGRQPGAERLVTQLPDALPACADPIHTAQAVTHLLVNALTYAPDSPVMLRAGPAPGPPGAVRVEVEDGGPGIPRAEQARVWERFYRGSTRLTAPERGAGLGLAVVKAVVEAQGGRVGLVSGPNGGSHFWLELPAASEPLLPGTDRP